MIEKDAQYIQLSCDKLDCKMTTDIHHRNDFSEMIEIAKSDGWKIFKRGQKWKHYCSQTHTS